MQLSHPRSRATIFELKQQRYVAEEAFCREKHGQLPEISLHNHRRNERGLGILRWDFQEQETFDEEKQYE
ncbi:CAP secretory protein [Perilla frutescens var. hirtella]|nr:CAP secretory protein [Perilla frutescens var. hirtella]